MNSLGIVDYGIYNVVGGIVAMFGFINNAMSSATSRYITFAIGGTNEDLISKTFSTSILIHLCITLFILGLGETVGLWFFYSKLQIPEARISTASWVYQLSILSSMVMIISIPYNAVIIAYEKMSAFAYISIIDVIIKLIIAYSISFSPYDKLTTYAFLLLGAQIINSFIYIQYCIHKFKIIKLQFIIDKVLFKQMTGFAAWSLFGCTANIMYTQGLNIILNMFFGPVVNAARGIAVQVQNTINNFAVNFQTAVNPQIVKYYVQYDLCSMQNLMFRSSKFSFYLLLIISLPIFFETESILTLWLRNVPENTVIFLRLILVTTLIDTISNPIMKAADATGNIKRYHVIIGCTLIMIAPVSYIVLKFGGPSYSVFIVHICFCIIALFLRLLIIKPMILLSIKKFFNNVLFPIIKVSAISVIIPAVIVVNMEAGWVRLIVSCFSCILSVGISIFSLGLNPSEKQFLKSKVLAFLNK